MFAVTPEQSEQAWLDKQRAERESEFAPPSFYTNASSNHGNSTGKRTLADLEKAWTGQEVKTEAQDTGNEAIERIVGDKLSELRGGAIDNTKINTNQARNVSQSRTAHSCTEILAKIPKMEPCAYQDIPLPLAGFQHAPPPPPPPSTTATIDTRVPPLQVNSTGHTVGAPLYPPVTIATDVTVPPPSYLLPGSVAMPTNTSVPPPPLNVPAGPQYFTSVPGHVNTNIPPPNFSQQLYNNYSTHNPSVTATPSNNNWLSSVSTAPNTWSGPAPNTWSGPAPNTWSESAPNTWSGSAPNTWPESAPNTWPESAPNTWPESAPNTCSGSDGTSSDPTPATGQMSSAPAKTVVPKLDIIDRRLMGDD